MVNIAFSQQRILRVCRRNKLLFLTERKKLVGIKAGTGKYKNFVLKVNFKCSLFSNNSKNAELSLLIKILFLALFRMITIIFEAQTSGFFLMDSYQPYKVDQIKKLKATTILY